MHTVQRLYPEGGGRYPLDGLYLAHDLRSRAIAAGRELVYTNFIASLDGRISARDPDSGRRVVPPAIANPDDWRLFLELAAQSDVLVTTARHLRAVAEGRHGGLLMAEGGQADLIQWRHEHGLPPRPAVAVVGEQLDFPAAALAKMGVSPLLVATTRRAPASRLHALEHAGIEVGLLGPGPGVDGAALVAWLADKGFRLIYSIAGPRLLHALLSAGRLDRLYLTVALQLLGGGDSDSLVAGGVFAVPSRWRLCSLYLEPAGANGADQLFACLEPQSPPGEPEG